MAAAQQALKVLVVEDDEDTAESTSLLLRTFGFETESACSGNAALEKAPVFKPDLMLIDLAMPHFDGLELANRFRLIPAFNNSPMIAVSGYVDAKSRRRAFDAGFDGFISKPFTKDDLAAACDRVQVIIAESKALTDKSKAAVAASRELSRRSRSDFWINRHGKEDQEA